MSSVASTAPENANGHGRKIVRIGVIGCGEISQVAHLPTLGFLSEYFEITYLCDVSQAALNHCAKRIAGSDPKLTKSAEELCSASNVDAVMVCSVTAFHPSHALLALQNDKHVFVEKPLALCYRDLDLLQAAERQSKGKVFVGYMRRYAPAFLHAIQEVGGDRSRIQYARVRDIIGPNADFVQQSGTFPQKFTDAISKQDSDNFGALDGEISEQCLLKEFEVPLNKHTKFMLNILGGLGSHDLSAMREAIGMPLAVTGANLSWPIWSVLFQYDGFPVVYESGINSVPVFDAHIEVYTDTKIVRVNYDTPYVKGLPITTTIREKIDGPKGESSYRESSTRITYEDAYTIELKDWYESVVNGKEIKTCIEDARQDLDLFKMMMRSAFGVTCS